MNTPGHYIFNLVLLGKTVAPHANVAITLGALIPDIPIFIFYGVAKYIRKLPPRQIWSEAYYEPFWQNVVASSHSIPLAAIGTLICWGVNWQPGMILFGSMILHCLCDFPVHHDDAHRHFFPFSNYRFISPFSYWDTRHYGKVVAFLEVLLVLGLTPLALGLLQSWVTKGIAIAINIFYLVGYFRFFRVSLKSKVKTES